MVSDTSQSLVGQDLLVVLQNLLGGEAADIDGCGAWDRLRSIVIPLISPTTFFIIVSSLISYLQAYVQVLVLTEGGPGTSTYLTSYIIYNEAFVKYNFGSASAMSFVLFVFIAALTALSFRLTGGEGDK